MVIAERRKLRSNVETNGGILTGKVGIITNNT